MSVGAPGPDGDARWRRLHPLTIVVKAAGRLAQNLPAVAILHFSAFGSNWTYTALAAAALLLLISGASALVWWRFSYRLGARDIAVRSGLLSRTHRSIPYERIQDASLTQKPLNRLLGLAAVTFETGAGSGEDATLDALRRPEAERLRDVVKGAQSTEGGGAALSATAEPAATLLFAMSPRRVLIAGLFNFSLVLFALLAALAQQVDAFLPVELFDPRVWAARLAGQERLLELSPVMRVAGLIVALGVVGVVGVASGLVTTVVREHGFRLERVEGKRPGFRRRRGLFTLTDTGMPLHRIQAALVLTGPVRAAWDWAHVKVQSLARDGSGDSNHSVAPCAKPDEIERVLRAGGIAPLPPGARFASVHPAYWWRRAIGIFLVVMSGVAVALVLGVAVGWFVLPGVALVLALPVFRLGWRRHGFLLAERQVAVRSGWWKRRLTLLPIGNVQSVDILQRPTDHLFGVASVVIGVAGGSGLRPLTVHALRLQEARRLRRALLGGGPVA